MNNDRRYVYEKIEMPVGGSLVIYGFRGDQNTVPVEDYCRNVELLSKEGDLIWKIATHQQNDTNFVGIIYRGEVYEAINSYGVAYEIDVKTGEIQIREWRK